MLKIVVADRISERGLALLRETGWPIATPGAAELASELSDAAGLIVRSATRVTAELLERAQQLRVVGRAGVGVDNIDVEAATRRGVLVMNTPGGNAASVAEHTIALLLALARSVPQLAAATRAGKWEKSGAQGIEVRGKTLGLVGLGRVGAEVARRARALEMRVVACDPFLSEHAARDAGTELVTFEKLLARADFVSLHTALSPATEKMLNAAALGKMKRGARLINTARGELVDEAALAEALRSGQLAGAALDVFAVEPPKNSPLLELPNVIATPHVAGSTAEAQEEVGTLIAQQVRDFLAEGMLRNAVNLPALSAEQYSRVRPYLVLGERLGSLVAQVAAGRVGRVRIVYAGEPAEIGTHVVRNAVLAGILNTALEEKVNLVNAAGVATARGLAVEEHTRRREQGFPNTIEVSSLPGDAGRALSVEGTVLWGTTPRILSIDGIPLEAPLEGVILFTRNRDVPGVIGQMGMVLGGLGINIATFALGRAAQDESTRPESKAKNRSLAPLGMTTQKTPADVPEALALIGLDGDVPDSVVEPIRKIAAVIEARVVRLL